MVNWLMRATGIHLNILYEELHRLLTGSAWSMRTRLPSVWSATAGVLATKVICGSTAPENQKNILSSSMITGITGKRITPENFSGTIPVYWWRWLPGLTFPREAEKRSPTHWIFDPRQAEICRTCKSPQAFRNWTDFTINPRIKAGKTIVSGCSLRKLTLILSG